MTHSFKTKTLCLIPRARTNESLPTSSVDSGTNPYLATRDWDNRIKGALHSTRALTHSSSNLPCEFLPAVTAHTTARRKEQAPQTPERAGELAAPPSAATPIAGT